MVTRAGCPQCGSQQFKKNGHIHNGKQNHPCTVCERQFVRHFDQRLISDDQRALVERLLLEWISLRGICRAVGVGLKVCGPVRQKKWGGMDFLGTVVSIDGIL